MRRFQFSLSWILFFLIGMNDIWVSFIFSQERSFVSRQEQKHRQQQYWSASLNGNENDIDEFILKDLLNQLIKQSNYPKQYFYSPSSISPPPQKNENEEDGLQGEREHKQHEISLDYSFLYSIQSDDGIIAEGKFTNLVITSNEYKYKPSYFQKELNLLQVYLYSLKEKRVIENKMLFLIITAKRYQTLVKYYQIYLNPFQITVTSGGKTRNEEDAICPNTELDSCQIENEDAHAGVEEKKEHMKYAEISIEKNLDVAPSKEENPLQIEEKEEQKGEGECKDEVPLFQEGMMKIEEEFLADDSLQEVQFDHERDFLEQPKISNEELLAQPMVRNEKMEESIIYETIEISKEVETVVEVNKEIDREQPNSLREERSTKLSKEKELEFKRLMPFHSIERDKFSPAIIHPMKNGAIDKDLSNLMKKLLNFLSRIDKTVNPVLIDSYKESPQQQWQSVENFFQGGLTTLQPHRKYYFSEKLCQWDSLVRMGYGNPFCSSFSVSSSQRLVNSYKLPWGLIASLTGLWFGWKYYRQKSVYVNPFYGPKIATIPKQQTRPLQLPNQPHKFFTINPISSLLTFRKGSFPLLNLKSTFPEIYAKPKNDIESKSRTEYLQPFIVPIPPTVLASSSPAIVSHGPITLRSKPIEKNTSNTLLATTVFAAIGIISLLTFATLSSAAISKLNSQKSERRNDIPSVQFEPAVSNRLIDEFYEEYPSIFDDYLIPEDQNKFFRKSNDSYPLEVLSDLPKLLKDRVFNQNPYNNLFSFLSYSLDEHKDQPIPTKFQKIFTSLTVLVFHAINRFVLKTVKPFQY